MRTKKTIRRAYCTHAAQSTLYLSVQKNKQEQAKGSSIINGSPERLGRAAAAPTVGRQETNAERTTAPAAFEPAQQRRRQARGKMGAGAVNRQGLPRCRCLNDGFFRGSYNIPVCSRRKGEGGRHYEYQKDSDTTLTTFRVSRCCLAGCRKRSPHPSPLSRMFRSAFVRV